MDNRTKTLVSLAWHLKSHIAYWILETNTLLVPSNLSWALVFLYLIAQEINEEVP